MAGRYGLNAAVLGMALGVLPWSPVSGGNFADMPHVEDVRFEAFQRIGALESERIRLGGAADRVRSLAEACAMASGEANACRGLDDAVATYRRAEESHQAAVAYAREAVTELGVRVERALAESCQATDIVGAFLNGITFGVRESNCEANKTGYRGYVGEVEAGLGDALDEHRRLVSGVDAAVTRAQQARVRAADAASMAALAAQREAEAALEARRNWARSATPTQLGDAIVKCRNYPDDATCKDGLTDFYVGVYREKTNVALRAAEMPPVLTFEEACAAWGNDPSNAFRAICDPEVRSGMEPAVVRHDIVGFLRNGPGRATECNRFQERCLAGNMKPEDEALRIAPDVEPERVVTGNPGFDEVGEIADGIADDVEAQGRRQRAVDSVLAGNSGSIRCQQGDASLLGMGIDCGEVGRLAHHVPDRTAPEFVPTSALATTEALGNGATVMKGDTLGHIAQAVRRQLGRPDLPLWGNGGLVDLLAAANGVTNPDRLNPKDGIRIPTKECLVEAAEAGSRQVLSECEELVRVQGVPENLQAAMRRARERIVEAEARLGRKLTDKERVEMLEDAANVAASPANDFAGLSSVPKADFIRNQTERFGEAWKDLITQVADEAEARGYNDDERFLHLERRMREASTD